MEPVVGLGLVALVLLLAALAAGLVERAPLSFPMIFLGLGLVLGDGVTGVVEIDLDSPVLEVVAFVTLSLVLFLDAINLDLRTMRGTWLVPALALGPGTVLVVAATAGLAIVLLDFEPLLAVLLGAILASTDPVVLRDVLRDDRVPDVVRRVLRVEAGTNDLIVLPPVLVLAALLTRDEGGAGQLAGFLAQLFIVGPLSGVVVGAGGAWLMGRADARFTIRHEFQALYGIGLVLAAFSVGETIGADGFLAAFAAGAAVTQTNNRLCDCFLEFGEVIAEMLMLLAFVLFGAVLSSMFGEVALVPTVVLGLAALLVIRPAAIGAVLALRPDVLPPRARAFIAWFGPRGLNSLLLALIAFGAGVPRGEELFAVTGVVVLLSVVIHGVSATPVTGLYARRVLATSPDPGDDNRTEPGS